MCTPRDDGVYNMITEAIFRFFFAFNSHFFSSNIKPKRDHPNIIYNVYYLVKCHPAEWFMASDTRFLTRRNNAHDQKIRIIKGTNIVYHDPFFRANIFLLYLFRIRRARCELVDGRTRTVSS